MQEKVMPEQEAMAAVYVGIDVCKDRLDVHLHPIGRGFAVANDASGLRRLKRLLAPYVIARVVMEATSRYHRAAHRSLDAAGLPVAVVNPLRARLFAEACGALAKTDAIDARMLALMAQRLDPVARPPAREAVEAVQELARARSAAVDERTAVGNRRAVTVTPFLQTELARRMRSLDTHIARLDRALEMAIAKDPILAQRHAILCSIPGIGAITATAVIANLDEIGTLSAKQASALAGLAPFARQSGSGQRTTYVRGGRFHLRRALYMAALAAVRFNPDLKRFAERLRAHDKPPKLILIAAARKLLITANALIAQNSLWKPFPA